MSGILSSAFRFVPSSIRGHLASVIVVAIAVGGGVSSLYEQHNQDLRQDLKDRKQELVDVRKEATELHTQVRTLEAEVRDKQQKIDASVHKDVYADLQKQADQLQSQMNTVLAEKAKRDTIRPTVFVENLQTGSKFCPWNEPSLCFVPTAQGGFGADRFVDLSGPSWPKPMEFDARTRAASFEVEGKLYLLTVDLNPGEPVLRTRFRVCATPKDPKIDDQLACLPEPNKSRRSN